MYFEYIVFAEYTDGAEGSYQYRCKTTSLEKAIQLAQEDIEFHKWLNCVIVAACEAKLVKSTISL